MLKNRSKLPYFFFNCKNAIKGNNFLRNPAGCLFKQIFVRPWYLSFFLFTILKKGGEVRERKGGNEDLSWHLESRLVSEGHSSTLRRKEKL